METKKSALTYILITVLAVSAYVPKAHAQYDSENDFIVSKLDNGKSIEITGYVGSKTEVRIPPTIQGLPITSIGRNAFWFCTGLASVNIPDSVTNIGNGAFQGCSSLIQVNIVNNNVTNIGRNAFSGIRGASVNIGNNVISIGHGAFSNCIYLTSVTFEGDNTPIGNDFSFPSGNSLRKAYTAGGKGTYTRASGGYTWTKTP